LHPGLVPGTLAVICLAVMVMTALRRDSRRLPEAGCLPATPATGRSFAAVIAAIAVLALATRPLGTLLSVSFAGFIGALGVRGIGIRRAALVGAGLGVAATLIFIILLRQPLPLWPGRW
jgi:hypothetical protein